MLFLPGAGAEGLESASQELLGGPDRGATTVGWLSVVVIIVVGMVGLYAAYLCFRRRFERKRSRRLPEALMPATFRVEHRSREVGGVSRQPRAVPPTSHHDDAAGAIQYCAPSAPPTSDDTISYLANVPTAAVSAAAAQQPPIPRVDLSLLDDRSYSLNVAGRSALPSEAHAPVVALGDIHTALDDVPYLRNVPGSPTLPESGRFESPRAAPKAAAGPAVLQGVAPATIEYAPNVRATPASGPLAEASGAAADRQIRQLDVPPLRLGDLPQPAESIAQVEASEDDEAEDEDGLVASLAGAGAEILYLRNYPSGAQS